MRIMRSWFVIIASVCALAATPKGVIQGVVVDEGGSPVAAAQVTTSYDLDSKDVEVQMGAVPTFETDVDGHFMVTNLNVGHQYKVYAQKEEAGYPNMAVGFFNPKDEAVIATAETQRRALDTRVRLGPKAAILSYDVRDNSTRKPIPNLTLYIKRMDEGDFGGTGCVDNRCLIPSDVPVTVEFSAKGYKTWYYPGSMNKAASSPLATVPGKATQLDVFLEPTSPKRVPR